MSVGTPGHADNPLGQSPCATNCGCDAAIISFHVTPSGLIVTNAVCGEPELGAACIAACACSYWVASCSFRVATCDFWTATSVITCGLDVPRVCNCTVGGCWARLSAGTYPEHRTPHCGKWAHVCVRHAHLEAHAGLGSKDGSQGCKACPYLGQRAACN